jgi:poly [ADP-ribose] polymerase
VYVLDPKQDVDMTIEGRKITVPQGAPKKSSFTSSSFHQSEYLVYKESQVRMRFVFDMTM